LKEAEDIMATLDNIAFEENPWRVSLEIGPQDHEGWRSCQFMLVYGAEHNQPLVSVSEGLYKDDLANLVNALRNLAQGTADRAEYEPLEPSFLLRGHRYSAEDIELAWFVDQGQLEANMSTESGVGVLMRADAAAVLQFAAALESEGI
jgi:hypothetical protein